MKVKTNIKAGHPLVDTVVFTAQNVANPLRSN